MSWPAIHRIHVAHKTQRRVALRLFAVVVALIALLPVAQPAHAATPPTGACLSAGAGAACAYLPPDLLNPNGATDAQRQSLQNLETTAISNTLADHGLPATDRTAVESWGRASAEAELFGLLKGAIATPATARTADQQNAVGWIAGVEQREAVAAAQNAGLEYAKWAGLDQVTYHNLLLNGASQSDLQSFLSTPPEGSLYDGGFCSYQAPAPYSSEYDPVNNAALCATPTGGGLGCVFSCVPTTPSYDQFVKWGEADASNASLSSSQTELAANYIAAGLVFGGVAAGTGTFLGAAGTGLADALVGTALQEAILPYAANVAYGADAAVGEAVAATEIASSAAVIVGVLIVAITTAVIEGINVTNAAALPDQLAALIANAEATPPDPATLLNSANGVQSLFSLFVDATLPAPSTGSCAGCLNAPAIPQPAFSDPYFIDTDTQIPGAQVGSSSYTQAPSGPTTRTTTSSITVADYTRGVTETARLSGHWFVLQPDGASAPTQSLSIAYTDWGGSQQVAWLVGNLTDGYQFVGYNATRGKTQQLDPATCLATQICWKASVLDYVGADGNLHEASVQTPSAATATVSYHDAFQNQPFAAYEGDPEIFAVTNPSQSIDYTWEFEQTPPCPGPAFGCLALNAGFTSAPDYTTPLDDPGGALSQSGAVAHTWPTSGQYRVRLTQTDQSGRSTTTTFTVNVMDRGPSITEDVFPSLSLAGVSFPQGTIYGQIKHYGKNDDEIVTLDWGDGSTDTATIGPDFVGLGGTHLGVGGSLNPPSALTLTADNTGNYPLINYAYSGPHTYAKGGTYHVTVSVLDQAGVVASQTQTVTVLGQPQAIAFPAIAQHTYGDAPFTITATGGASSNPVTFAVVGDSGACALSNASDGSGTGSATVTVLTEGSCRIAASQAGGGPYDAAPSVEQDFFIEEAPLTVTASSASMTYGGATPAITPTYSGFVNGDTVARLTTPATCTASTLGANPYVGTYRTTCTGVVAPNYHISAYAPGTLTVAPAPLTITAHDQTMTYGSATPRFTATDSGLVNRDGPLAVLCRATDAAGQPVGGGTPAGSYPITCSAAGTPEAANYAITFVSGTLTIAPAPLTVTANDKTMTYGDAVPAFDAQYSGLVTGDTSAVVTGLTCGATDGNGQPVSSRTPVGTYSISCSGGTAANYTITRITGTLTIAPAPLTVAAAPLTTPYGTVPATYPWTGSGWVNGESAAALTTPPTCVATIGGGALTATTAPGVYPGAIACHGAADPNYAITYTAPVTLTVDPLLALDEQGLPGTVPHRATLDGHTVSLPDRNVEVAYGSRHSYSFPATVTDPGSGAIYVTADAGYSGTVTANISDTASYQTVAHAVAAALASGGIDSSGLASALTQQFAAVQQDVKAGNTAQALADLHTFASAVRAQAGKHVAAATAQTLLAAVQTVYASLGGTGSV